MPDVGYYVLVAILVVGNSIPVAVKFGHNKFMAETLTFENFVVTVGARRGAERRYQGRFRGRIGACAGRFAAIAHSCAGYEKTTWIERKNAEAERKRAGIAEQAEISATLTNGSTILVQGEPLSLRLCESDDMRVVQISDCLEIRCCRFAR